jgi:hypothetical protein
MRFGKERMEVAGMDSAKDNYDGKTKSGRKHGRKGKRHAKRHGRRK